MINYRGRVYDDEGLQMIPDIEGFLLGVKAAMIVPLYKFLDRLNPNFYRAILNSVKNDYNEAKLEALSAQVDIDPGELHKIIQR